MKVFYPVFGFVLFLMVGCFDASEPTLPVYGFKKVVEKTVNGETIIDSLDHQIPPFSLVDQDSTVITEKTVNGKIYLVDFFFTSCFTICPKVKKNMKRVYQTYKDQEDVLILSHSIDYRYDTVGRLAWYADKFGIEAEKWHLLHGSYEDMLRMSYAYLLTALEDKEAPGGFDHSGSIALLDRKRRIRGFYDGTDADKMDDLIRDIAILLNE